MISQAFASFTAALAHFRKYGRKYGFAVFRNVSQGFAICRFTYKQFCKVSQGFTNWFLQGFVSAKIWIFARFCKVRNFCKVRKSGFLQGLDFCNGQFADSDASGAAEHTKSGCDVCRAIKPAESSRLGSLSAWHRLGPRARRAKQASAVLQFSTSWAAGPEGPGQPSKGRPGSLGPSAENLWSLSSF